MYVYIYIYIYFVSSLSICPVVKWVVLCHIQTVVLVMWSSFLCHIMHIMFMLHLYDVRSWGWWRWQPGKAAAKPETAVRDDVSTFTGRKPQYFFYWDVRKITSHLRVNAAGHGYQNQNQNTLLIHGGKLFLFQVLRAKWDRNTAWVETRAKDKDMNKTVK